MAKVTEWDQRTAQGGICILRIVQGCLWHGRLTAIRPTFAIPQMSIQCKEVILRAKPHTMEQGVEEKNTYR